MKDCNCDLRDGDAKTAVFGSNEMLQPAPVDTIPMEPTTPASNCKSLYFP